ncbi:MAG: hypothetical protein AAFU60_12625, partial [Bacteroidota bacterium]
MRLLFSGLLCSALSFLLFLVSSCNHANLTGFTALPKQTACIFQAEGSSKDSFPALAAWPGWDSFAKDFQKDLLPLPSAKVSFSPFCLQGELQWLAIWELEEPAPKKPIATESSWEQSIFQGETIYFKDQGNAMCSVENLVLFASMPILIEDALRAIEAPKEGAAEDLLAPAKNTWTFIPSKLKEAGQSCWNLSAINDFFATLPPGAWSGPIFPDSNLIWWGASKSSAPEFSQEGRFPFWEVLPVDLVWATFSGTVDPPPARSFWLEPLQQLPFGTWFMQGSLESQPKGSQDLFAAIQLRGDLDSLTLPGLLDPSLVPDFPMLATHRVEARGTRSAYWVFQLKDVLFIVPSREQAYTLINRFINNQTLEVLGGQFKQSISGNTSQQFLYYRSALDEGWYESIWQKDTDPSIKSFALKGTYLLGQTINQNWHWVQ